MGHNIAKLAATGFSVDTDANFKDTVLLLHGDGTSGAQNNSFDDESTNNFSITPYGNTTQGTFSPFSQTGWSNYFDGTGDYLSVADNTALTLTGDFTIECWVYPTSVSGTDSIIARWQVSNQEFLLWIDAGVPAFYFAPYSAGTALLTSSSSISANTWTHIAVVRSGNSFTMYVNGVSKATATNSGTFTNTSAALEIGLLSGYAGYDYAGYISNVRLVKGTAVYTANFTPPTSPLTAITNTSLLTCQSNRFVDNSTNAFALTVNGNPSVQAFSPFAPTAAYSAATNGGSGYFDGTGDYLSTSTSQIIPTGSFTIEAWVYTTQAISTNKYIVSQGTSGDSGRTGLGIEGSAYWFQIGGDYVNAGTPVLGQWNYVAMTFNGSTIQGYVNGVSQGSVSHTGNSQNTTLTVGTNWNSNAWNGYIASVRISNTVRTVTTVPTAPFADDANTKFLCNFTNAGIYDATAKNVLETVGNAQIDTGTKKFGTGALEFDGSGDDLRVINAGLVTGFGAGDFTVEFWVYANSWGAYNNLVDFRKVNDYFLIIYTSDKIQFYNNGSYRIDGGSLSTTTWYHIAVSRSGTSTKMFVNGTQVGSTYTDSSSYPAETVLTIGGRNDDAGNPFNGFIDDLRITKGVARYTANFTAPTKAFADQ